MAIDYSQQTRGKAGRLKTTPTYLMEQREDELVPTESFLPADQCACYCKELCMMKEKGEHQARYKAFGLTKATCLHDDVVTRLHDEVTCIHDVVTYPHDVVTCLHDAVTQDMVIRLCDPPT